MNQVEQIQIAIHAVLMAFICSQDSRCRCYFSAAQDEKLI